MARQIKKGNNRNVASSTDRSVSKNNKHITENESSFPCPRHTRSTDIVPRMRYMEFSGQISVPAPFPP
jgi:hypothetical protein